MTSGDHRTSERQASPPNPEHPKPAPPKSLAQELVENLNRDDLVRHHQAHRQDRREAHHLTSRHREDQPCARGHRRPDGFKRDDPGTA